MKNIYFILPLLAIVIAACSPENTLTESEPQPQLESYTISLAMQGEVTISEEPLTRAPGVETASRDLYGILVYYNKDKDSNLDDLYGYGLFDNVADMTISLLTGYKYKFVCTLIEDGKDKVYYISETLSYEKIGYLEPFGDYVSSYYYGQPVENQFTLGGSLYNECFALGSGRTASGPNRYNYTDYPETDRYYGETTNYTPTNGGVVNIDMKRCVFGVKYVISGLTDGTFTVSPYTSAQSYYSSNTISRKSFTSTKSTEEVIYTFYDVDGCWGNTGVYSENFTLSLSWLRGNGVTQDLGTQAVTFKRNVMTTVNINLNGASHEASFGVNEENTPMGEDTTNINLEAGDPTDNTVDP